MTLKIFETIDDENRYDRLKQAYHQAEQLDVELSAGLVRAGCVRAAVRIRLEAPDLLDPRAIY